MIYIECPNVLGASHEPERRKSLFMAGGITNCPNWQLDFANLLAVRPDLIVLNPRRMNFPSKEENPNIDNEQITWEFDHIQAADAISFWFTDATVQPITLFELGKACVSKQNLFVGVDPNYMRRNDVEIQLGLERPNVQVAYSLEELAAQVIDWVSFAEEG